MVLVPDAIFVDLFDPAMLLKRKVFGLGYVGSGFDSLIDGLHTGGGGREA